MRKDGVSLTQTLIEPVSVILSNQEMIIYSQNIEFIAALGYETEIFGDNTLLIRSIPSDKSQGSIIEEFMIILNELRKQNHEITDENIAMIACKSSIKGNTKLDPAHAAALISRLMTTDNPLNCPHGRTIIQVISKKDLEKLFQRRL
jgi:DNA mismatch repair protein MutL